MLTAEEILKHKKQIPFVRFRITLRTGESYDVMHPDLVMVGRRDIMVGFAGKRDPAIHDRSVRISFLDMATITELPLPSQTEFYTGYA